MKLGITSSRWGFVRAPSEMKPGQEIHGVRYFHEIYGHRVGDLDGEHKMMDSCVDSAVRAQLGEAALERAFAEKQWDHNQQAWRYEYRVVIMSTADLAALIKRTREEEDEFTYERGYDAGRKAAQEEMKKAMGVKA